MPDERSDRTASAQAGAPPPPASAGRSGATLAVLSILAFGALLWLWGAGRVDVHGSMEGSRALVPQQMMRTGDYVVPRRGDQVYLAKPPLFYWAVVATSRATGGAVTAWSVRAVAALALIGIVLIGWAAVRRLAGERAAWIAAATLATTRIVLDARDGNLDTLLAFDVGLATVAAFFVAEGGPRARAAAVACGVGIGAGLLTKGPIVLVFLVPTMLLYAGFLRQGPIARSRRRFVPWLAGVALSIGLVALVAPSVGRIAAVGYVVPAAMVAIFVRQGEGAVGRPRLWLLAAAVAVAIATPWVVLVTQRLGAGAWLENLDREVWRERMTAVGTSNRGPIWTYAVEFTASTLPWLVFAALAFLPRFPAPLSTPRGRWILFLRCWLLGSFVLFTVVGESRRLRYLFPAYPAAALLAADAIARAWEGSLDDRLRVHVSRLACATAIVAALVPLVIAGNAMRAHLGLGGWTAVALGFALAGSVAAAWLLRRRSVYAAALASVAFALVAFKTYDDFANADAYNAARSPRPGAERIRSHVPAGEELRLAGLPPHPAAYYLNALPVEPILSDPARLSAQERLFVVVEERDEPDFRTPAAFERTEIDRAPVPGGVLVLLRLDRKRP